MQIAAGILFSGNLVQLLCGHAIQLGLIQNNLLDGLIGRGCRNLASIDDQCRSLGDIQILSEFLQGFDGIGAGGCGGAGGNLGRIQPSLHHGAIQGQSGAIRG